VDLIFYFFELIAMTASSSIYFRTLRAPETRWVITIFFLYIFGKMISGDMKGEAMTEKNEKYKTIFQG
jgi:hypothetical protein